ncbi:MAG: hypothetical protein QXT77_05450 [Candidatus Methanomethylicaceae archaeon]
MKDLLELLYTAHDRFSSLQATFRYWYKSDLMETASKRWTAQQPLGSVSSEFRRVMPWRFRLALWLYRFFKKEGSKAQETKGTTEFLWRIWLQKPSRWRYESQEVGRAASISIIDGDRWWYYDPTDNTLHTNVAPKGMGLRIRKSKITLSDNLINIEQAINEVPSLDPTFLLVTHTLQLVGSAVHAGREALRVRAVPRRKELIGDPFFWDTADEYDLLVDKERGILLRYSAQLNSQEYAVVSAESVVFDEPIPDNTFSFTPTSSMIVYVVEG